MRCLSIADTCRMMTRFVINWTAASKCVEASAQLSARLKHSLQLVCNCWQRPQSKTRSKKQQQEQKQEKKSRAEQSRAELTRKKKASLIPRFCFRYSHSAEATSRLADAHREKTTRCACVSVRVVRRVCANRKTTTPSKLIFNFLFFPPALEEEEEEEEDLNKNKQ